jgi:hypothetical protein
MEARIVLKGLGFSRAARGNLRAALAAEVLASPGNGFMKA